jgi:hypothetical protein
VLAVMSSVGIVVGVCATLGWCGYSAVNLKSAGPVGLFIGSFSPFTVMTLLIDPYQFAERIFEDTDQITARVVIFIASFAAVAAYAAVVWGMYKSMVKNFDMTIRRQSR